MTNTVMDILKQKHHPELYEAEQARLHKERLAFIEGFKASKEIEKATSKPLFVSDDSPKGFTKNN